MKLPPQRIKKVRKELGKLVLAQTMSAKNMAAFLGQVRAFLLYLPFLRAFTDSMCHFVQVHSQVSWSMRHLIPATLKE